MTSAADTIWKYMDLGKFAYLLETGCLYFASPAQFEDDLEGRVPKSHEESFEALVHDSFIAPIAALRPHFASASDSLAAFDALLAKAGDALPEARRKAPLRFVVSCWHQSPSESEWMWDEYAGHGTGVAIESTIEGLELALQGAKGLVIEEIRYANYDSDPIERGHRRYRLFMKRNCYAREKELRATMLRPEEDWETDAAKRGIAVACDLNALIKAIHVTPASMADASALIAKFRGRRPELIGKPVLVSTVAKPSGRKAAV